MPKKGEWRENGAQEHSAEEAGMAAAFWKGQS